MANIYDRIFKENIEPIIPILAEKIFGVVITKTIEIKDKIQITLEGEADYLKKILHEDPSEDFILHIEFQVKNEPKMINRMLLYRAFLYNKYEIPVKQFVFYVGDKKTNMQTGFIQEGLIYNFSLRNIKEYSYELFIHSDKPEEVILAILSDFKGESTAEIIKKTLKQLNDLTGNSLKLLKYIKQLEVLSNLRNLQEETIKQIQIMSFTYDLETDIRYKQGIEKGIEKSIKEGIIAMWNSKLLTIEQIASIQNVSVSFVEKIIKS